MEYQETIMYQEILQQSRVLSACAELNRFALKQAADAFGARRVTSVVVAARGSSNNAGQYFKYLFETVTGIPVSFAYPSTRTLYNACPKYDDAMVIGISQSGAAADVLEIVNSAKAQGALCISITNKPDSALAQAADIHLNCGADEERSVAATKTFTAQMYLLALLTQCLSGDTSLKSALTKVPAQIDRIIKAQAKIVRTAKNYKSAKLCYVLARGFGYPAALETALKIRETTYINATAYAVSDFYHGPFAVIDNKSKVLLLAPDDSSRKDCEEMLVKLKGAGADVTAICSTKIDAQRVCVLPLKSHSYTLPFGYTVAMQIFACALSCLRGLNPDAPRGLQKVTITK